MGSCTLIFLPAKLYLLGRLITLVYKISDSLRMSEKGVAEQENDKKEKNRVSTFHLSLTVIYFENGLVIFQLNKNKN